MFVPCACCVLYRQRPLRRADHSFRGALPVCVCVCNCVLSRNLKNGGLRPSWAVVPQKNGNLNTLFELDTVGTVYHLVIYMQSNKIHKVF